MEMMFCAKCIAAAEPPVKIHDLFSCPPGVCPCCWYRYGKYIPICTTGSELKPKKKGKGKK